MLFCYVIFLFLSEPKITLFIDCSNTREGDSHGRFCILERLFIYKLIALKDMTGLYLSTSELTELNTKIFGVLFFFTLCQLMELTTVAFRAT